jgi:hypothetical protein
VNLDLSLAKLFFLSWPRENSSFQFRAEFFIALNHPQVANPDTNFTSPVFGAIIRTALNPGSSNSRLSSHSDHPPRIDAAGSVKLENLI